jgi:hypothetical protein
MSKLRRRKKNQKGDKFTLINQVYMEYNITQTIFLKLKTNIYVIHWSYKTHSISCEYVKIK